MRVATGGACGYFSPLADDLPSFATSIVNHPGRIPSRVSALLVGRPLVRQPRAWIASGPRPYLARELETAPNSRPNLLKRQGLSGCQQPAERVEPTRRHRGRHIDHLADLQVDRDLAWHRPGAVNFPGCPKVGFALVARRASLWAK